MGLILSYLTTLYHYLNPSVNSFLNKVVRIIPRISIVVFLVTFLNIRYRANEWGNSPGGTYSPCNPGRNTFNKIAVPYYQLSDWKGNSIKVAKFI